MSLSIQPVRPTPCDAAYAPAVVPTLVVLDDGTAILGDDHRPVLLGPAVLFRYFRQRHAIALGCAVDERDVEDDATALLRHVLSRTTPAVPLAANVDRRRQAARRRLADAAAAVMSSAISAQHPIAGLARRLGTSPFHLAHVFRAEMGLSIHQYLLELRLAAALRRLRAGTTDLSMLALELGFAHHSHFSAVFRQAVGWTPRDARRLLSAQSVTELGIASRRCG